MGEENIDMSIPRKATIALMATCSMVLAIVLMLPGIAAAQAGFSSGVIDFCNNDPATGKPYYDNAQQPAANPLSGTAKPPVYTYPQSFGSFTDLGHTGWTPPNTNTIENRPNEINMFQNMHSTTNPSGTNPWGDSPTKPQTC